MRAYRSILIINLILLVTNLKAQSILTVRDPLGNPVENAQVIYGDFIGLSDQDGRIEIAANPKISKLQVSLIGYDSQEISLSAKDTEMNVTLVPKGIVLNELIINSDLFKNKKRETSGSIAILKKVDLVLADQTNISPVLNSVPGLFMHSGALNTNRITIRGLGSRSLFSTNKIKAYLDDIPLSTGEGETTIEDIDLNLLDHIEVIRGPASSLFGAGLGGVINMSLSQPNETNKATSDLMIGSFGSRRGNFTVNVGDQKKGLGILYQNIQSDGYRQNNEYDRSSISLVGKIKTSNQWNFTSFVNITSLKAFIPSSIDSTTFKTDPSAAAQNWLNARGFEDNDKFRIGISGRRSLSQKLGTRMSVFLNGRQSFEVRPFNILEEDVFNYGFRGLLIWSIDDSGKLEGVIGTELFREEYNESTFENNNSVKGSGLSNFDQDRNYSNIFSSIEYRPGNKWKLSAGANLNLSSYKTIDQLNTGPDNLSAHYNFDPIFSPQINILHHIKSDLSIYLQWSHGYSLPTFDETLNPDGLINNDIQPETGFNYELGLKGSSFNNKVYFELSAYSMRIRDLLVARRVSEDDFIGINAGRTVHNGLEGTINHSIVDNDNFSFDHNINFTYSNYFFDEFIDDEEDFSGNALTGVPDYNMTYKLSFLVRKKLYGNINWQLTGSMPIRDDNSIFTESYKILNAKMGYRTKAGKFSFDIYAGINNILDEAYASMILINAGSFGGRAPRYFYPGLPVNWFSGIKVNMQL